MSDKDFCRANVESEKPTKTARSSDLTTRERVNFVLSSSLMDDLRKKSADEQVPMSRIIDAALSQYLNKKADFRYEAKLDNGIPLYHSIEIMLFIAHDSEETKSFLENLYAYFRHYTYSSCLYKRNDKKTVIGTKVLSYVSDSNNHAFGTFLDALSKLEYKEDIKVMLDRTEIQI